MMFDKVEKFSKSIIQHGPYNDRIYLMKVGQEEDIDVLIEKMMDLAIVNEYTKIFIKIPEHLKEPFLGRDFKLEAKVPGYYKGQEASDFLGLYLNAKRGFLLPDDKQAIARVIETAQTADASEVEKELPAEFTLHRLGYDDVPELASIYHDVFQFYPFPIHRESYLRETMASDVIYFGVRQEGKLVAVSSADVDKKNSSAEMTDFATLKAFRGHNLSYFLLKRMLEEIKAIDLKVVYTIARAKSYGMNKTFGRHGFEFSGTLINNTRIGDSIESMNVWYKEI